MKRIVSDVVEIDNTLNLTEIETILSDKFGDVVRWAIVEVNDEFYKISLSYELKEA